MNCTWLVGKGRCGRETGYECPPEWAKHQRIDPRAIHIFMRGTPGEEFLPTLTAFCCSEHRKLFLVFCERSDRAMSSAAKRESKRKLARLQNDYAI